MVIGLTISAFAEASEQMVPTARFIIYPGDLIQDHMLDEVVLDVDSTASIMTSRGEVVGLVAKRTLFPGRPINVVALETRHTIANGSLVQIVYEMPGLSITASGLALQAGRIGDAVRVRNVESGLAVTGVVLPSGAILVGR